MVYRLNLAPVSVLIALFLVLQTTLLTSCAHISTPPVDTDLNELPPQESTADPSGANRFQLSDFENSLYRMPVWQLSGRLSIRSQDEILSGSLRWRQQQDTFIINFNSPFGQGALQIKGDADGVELETADGRSLQADDLDQLFEEAAGWELPLSGLRYWVFGVPSPDSQAVLQREMESSQQNPTAGHIIEIRQSDWVVNIPRYVKIGQHELPRKLRLRSTDYESKLQVRLVVDNWQLQDEIDLINNIDANTLTKTSN